MKNKLLFSVVLLFVLLAFPVRAAAASYSFGLPKEDVQAYWNADGTLAIDYTFVFQNDPGASPIDYVDVGIPNSNYDLSSITADVDGWPITDIQTSQYVSIGVALGLGARAIPPGASGTVHAHIPRVSAVLHPDSGDSKYASAVFSPTWFDSSAVHGTTDLTVTFHLPPGVGPNDPRYHNPQNWPGANEPATSLDSQGLVVYSWNSPSANGYMQYTFGASFPASVVPASAIITKNILDELAGVLTAIIAAAGPCLCVIGFFLFIVVLGVAGAWQQNQRKKDYLPPTIAIEGHGIKRGLTAVEAALLAEQPLDRVMTMILFGVVKKNAATVTSTDPLQLKVSDPVPAGLYPYETDFLAAFQTTTAGVPVQSNLAVRRKALQDMTINMLKSLQEKMKGFSRRETLDYYKTITEKAWAQVTAAGTPEVKAQALDDNLEWTMADRDFETRSQTVFGGGPVFVPIWWGHYDPHFGGGTAAPIPSVGGLSGPISLPHLPGADFAGSIVGGVQSFSKNVIGDLTGFTSNITNKTNPIPVATSTGGGWHGGGGGCACACACAGCACACAGGGR
ncbi:MAG: hypothetical protein ABSA10_09415 [Anaerolineales bacterium]